MGHKKGQQPSSFAHDPRFHFDSPALRGNFIPLADGPARCSETERSRGLRIQVSLSESEMGRLAAVLSPDDTPTRKAREMDKVTTGNARGRSEARVDDCHQETTGRSRSPAKLAALHLTSKARSKSPSKFSIPKISLSGHKNNGKGKKYQPEEDFNSSPITAFFPSPIQERSKRRSTVATREVSPRRSIAERRNIETPPMVDTTLARQQAKQQVLDHLGPGAVIIQCPPPENTDQTTVRQSVNFPIRETSSVYTEDDETTPSAVVSPLRVKKDIPNILGNYTSWRNSPVAPDLPLRVPLTHSRSTCELATRDRQSSKETTATVDTELMFSPLTPFFQTEANPGVRKSSKTLIGDDGWLEKTAQLERAKMSPHRKGGFLDSIVKKAKDLVDKADAQTQRASRDSKTRKTRSLAISFSMREQSLIYCDLEFLLSVSLNGYLTCQFNSGRLDAQKLSKIEEGWKQKGRPGVSSFHYDLETQLELLRVHVYDFKFYGRLASAPASILGFIDIMKVNARTIRVRTLCQPDTVIAKQIVDTESLFNLLGVPDEVHSMLQNVRHFFREVLRIKAMHSWSSAEHSSFVDTMQTWETINDGPRPEPRISRHVLQGDGDLEYEMWSEAQVLIPKAPKRSTEGTAATGRRSPFKSVGSRKQDASTLGDYSD